MLYSQQLSYRTAIRRGWVASRKGFKANCLLRTASRRSWKRAGDAFKLSVFLGQQAEMEIAKNENP
jgi:hypothetical protein